MNSDLSVPSRPKPSGAGALTGILHRGLTLSLRQKLLGVILLTTLVSVVVALVAMVGYGLRQYSNNWAADVTTQAELLGRTIAPALAFDDPRAARENLDLLRYRPRIRAAAVYNARGGQFASFVQAGEEPRFPKLPEADGVRTEGADLVVFRRIVENGEILGTVYFRAENAFLGEVASYAGIALLVALLAMGVAAAMSSWLQKIITQPILDITQLARDVTERRDYTRRAEKVTNDEVGLLAESFNGMLGEIERRSGEMEISNQRLAAEVAERRRTQDEVARLNTELEDRVRERTAQLQNTNAELEAFCYSVSHDLRAPLRGIDGFSAALREDFAASLPEEAQRYLDIIQTSAQRMGQLIEDLLNLSRVSRDTMDVVPVDLTDIANQVVRDLRQRDAGREVVVSVWDGMQAQGDPRLLKAALENLIGNAWKFTSKVGAARIDVGALVGAQSESGSTTYYVRDNGAGFDMAFAPKLFRAFQRLHSEEEFTGTGIGLATVQRIVARHGGRIWVDSKIGKGTVFYFTLAAQQAAEAAAAMPEAARAAGAA